MKEQSEENTKKEVIEKKTICIFRGHLFIKLVIILLLVLAVIAGIAGLRKGGGQPAESESKTTRIGFENIGQMVTQAAYCTEMNVTKDSRKLFGMTIPFTQSEYIYSYDVEVRAGLDFSQIVWSVDEENSIIQVRLPQVQILSSEINTDTFKVYHEEESIFTPIKLADNNDALKTLIENAKQDAVANGLLENAESNAETILRGFFANVYDLQKYKIEFIRQEAEK